MPKLINDNVGDLAVEILKGYGFVAGVKPEALAEQALRSAVAMYAALEAAGLITDYNDLLDEVEPDDPDPPKPDEAFRQFLE